MSHKPSQLARCVVTERLHAATLAPTVINSSSNPLNVIFCQMSAPAGLLQWVPECSSVPSSEATVEAAMNFDPGSASYWKVKPLDASCAGTWPERKLMACSTREVHVSLQDHLGSLSMLPGYILGGICVLGFAVMTIWVRKEKKAVLWLCLHARLPAALRVPWAPST